jgi:hypothetical protein
LELAPGATTASRTVGRADDELKQVEEAITKADRDTFLVEVPKKQHG